MNNLLFLFFLLWILGFITNIFLQLYWWQIKEYRLDRFKDFLSTDIGKQLLFSKLNIVKLFVLISLIIFPLMGTLVFIVFYGVLVLKIIFRNSAIFPKWTLRMKETFTFLILFFLIIGFSFFSVLQKDYLITLIILDLISPLLVGFSVLFIGKLVGFHKQNLISKASKKISSMEKLIVIGVTGSYGKTTTKEFIGQLISSKYRVLVTPAHVNTEIGVAQFIIQKLTPKTEVFVVEMGAYRIGEITSLCKLTKPQIGVLTAISNQHLALFGSQENITKAKFELVDYLEKNQGIIILNKDDVQINKIAPKYNLKKIFFSINKKTDIYADAIIATPDSLKFIFHFDNQKFNIVAKIIGKQNVANILTAIAVGKELNIPLQNLIQKTTSLKGIKATMELVFSIKGATLIDDTYNINSEGIKMALDTLKNYQKSNKIIVLSPIIELGNQTTTIHQEILRYALEKVDKIIWVGMDFIDIIQDFIKTNKVEEQIKFYKSPKEAANFLINFNSSDSVILFEGRNAEKVLEIIK
ncbi:MAG: UDP-N-acetylmuramoyl-tripeptide--D-alanyl-D-alanine ligase [Candidatus Daviesbacteria bacterium]|nr:UDP-N-acetylmuramoyl-tripeptide--D-alanyl-D-alanine ligase [Candidatus Daviesbacteria bacterium]